MLDLRLLATAAALTLAAPAAHAHDRDYAHVHREKPAEGDAEPTVYASIDVDASEIGASGTVVRDRINERAGLTMHEAGILPARDREDATLRVHIQPAANDEPGYVLQVWIERAGATEGTRNEVDCTLCTETELVDRAVGEIAQALATIQPDDPETAGVGEPAPPPDDPTGGPALDEPSPPESGSVDRQRRPLGRKGKLGIGLLVGGAVIAGTGIGLAIPAPQPLSEDPTNQRSFRPPGYALIGVGAAGLVTGAVLLAVDREMSRRTRASATIGPGFAGLAILRHF